MKTSCQNKQGFTLIELSIVLVIIGLIVGGILTGQDMIKAAQIRASISQLEKYSTAVNTFRSKYNGMPGDVANCTTFFAAADCPTTGTTNGNAVFEDTSGTKVLLSGENVGFWHHLYSANLIGEAMTDTQNINGTAAGTANLANIIPAAKIGNGNNIILYTSEPTNTNYPGMAGVNVLRIVGITALAAGVPTLANDLTPTEAFQFDSKLDDGVPNSGVVQATDNTANFNLNTDAPSAPGVTKCLSGAAVYNTTTANGAQNNRLCQIITRPSF